MSNISITPSVMQGFLEALKKEAAIPLSALTSAARRHLGRAGTRHAIQAGLGSGLSLGAVAGAGLGGLRSGVDAYRQAKEHGAGTGQALSYGLGSGATGAVRGAVGGAVLGGAGGALAGAARPVQAIRATRAMSGAGGPLGSVSRFGQRQVHGFTGFKPGGSSKAIERLGAGAAPARESLSRAVKSGKPKEIARAKVSLRASEEAQRMGLTSLPGIAKSVKQRGLLPTAATGFKEQWAGGSPLTRALMVGYPAMAAGSALASEEVPGEPGKAERVGRALGSVGYLAAPLSIVPSLALGAATEGGGGMVGKAVDRLRGKKRSPHPPATEPGDDSSVPSEHLYSRGVE